MHCSKIITFYKHFSFFVTQVTDLWVKSGGYQEWEQDMNQLNCRLWNLSLIDFCISIIDYYKEGPNLSLNLIALDIAQ